MITIRNAKFDRAPAGAAAPDRTEALRRYASSETGCAQRPRSRAFFLSSAGTAVLAQPARQDVQADHDRDRRSAPRPCVRASTISGTVLRSHPHRLAPLRRERRERIAALSTYLGHVAPRDTYWYLSARPS